MTTPRALVMGMMLALAPGTLQAQLPGQLLQANAPHASPAVFDPARGVVVTVEGGNGGRLWEWNGTRWNERIDVPTGALATGYRAAVYDTRRARTLWLRSTSPLTVDEFDGAQWHFPGQSAPAAGLVAGAAFDPVRGRMVVLHSDSSPSPAMAVAEWDGSRWWTFTPTGAPPARQDGAVAYDPLRHAVVCFGGSPNFSDTWTWDGASFTRIAGAGPSAREHAAFGFDPGANRLLLFGGNNYNVLLSETWTFDASGWQQLQPQVSPTARASSQLLFDGSGMFLLGGSDSPFNLDPAQPYWRWTGSNWQPLPVDGEPDGRRKEEGMVWDETRGEVLLFGGSWQSAIFYGDTWTWNGSWHRHFPAASPTARHAMGLAPDPQRGNVVLFSGAGAPNDTWTWDGVNWTLQQPANAPAARYSAVMAYDRARNVVLLHGGTDGTTVFGDFWQWNGSNWSTVAAAGGPSPRYGHAMAYDEARSRMVMYGGQGPNGYLVEVWEWDGVAWTSFTPHTAPWLPSSWLTTTFDAVRSQVALLSSNLLYHWTGSDWAFDVTLLGSGNLALAADPVRQTLLSFPNQAGPGGRIQMCTTLIAAVSDLGGGGCASGIAPGLVAIGRPQPGAASFHFDVQALASSAPVMLLAGLHYSPVLLGSGCVLEIGQPAVAQFAVATAGGWAGFPVTVPANQALLGLQLFAQAAVLDPAHSVFAGITMTGGLRVTVGW